MTKPLHVGQASVAGIVAADLAKLGLTGPRYILEGEFGLFSAMTKNPDVGAIGRPAESWKIAETGYKPWGSCAHTFPAIVATLKLTQGSKPIDIRRVTLETSAEIMSFADCAVPQTAAEAKFSLQHAIATVLRHGTVPIDAFELSGLSDPGTRLIREKVSVVESLPPFWLNAGEQEWARVEVELGNGEIHSEMCGPAEAAQVSNLSESEVISKACELMAGGGVKLEYAQTLCDSALSLASGGPMGDFVAALDAASNLTSYERS